MEKTSKYLQDYMGLSPSIQNKLIATLVAIIILWFIRRLILLFSKKKFDDVQTIYHWRKTSLYIVFSIGFILVGRIWFEGFGSIATYLGLLSAGLAIALNQPVANLAGWAFIIWRKPFTVGDRIEINNITGDVIDIRVFQFTMMEIGNWVDADQSTGRIVHVPNGKIFNEWLANYSAGFAYIWNEVSVLVTFESNWRKAKEILGKIVVARSEHHSDGAEEQIRDTSKRFLIFYDTLEPSVYTSVRESGVLITIRYLCAPRKRRITEHEIWEDVLTEFAKCSDIDFAYPTQRLYRNITEGKENARAKNTAESE